MKYWWIHLFLIMVLVSVWVPAQFGETKTERAIPGYPAERSDVIYRDSLIQELEEIPVSAKEDVPWGNARNRSIYMDSIRALPEVYRTERRFNDIARVPIDNIERVERAPASVEEPEEIIDVVPVESPSILSEMMGMYKELISLITVTLQLVILGRQVRDKKKKD